MRITGLMLAIVAASPGCRSGSAPAASTPSSSKAVKPASKAAPVPPPPAIRTQDLVWLDENRLQLRPGTVLNVDNEAFFGDAPLRWSDSDDDVSCSGDPDECADNKIPVDAKRSRAGDRAWIKTDASPKSGTVLCLAGPALAGCPEVDDGALRCSRLVDGPEPVEAHEPATDPLSLALRDEEQIFMPHRGLKDDDGGGCFGWSVHTDAGSILLTRRDVENGEQVEAVRDIGGGRNGYLWGWSKYHNGSVYDEPPEPDEHQPRPGCLGPETEPNGSYERLLCYTPIGRFVRESDTVIELSELTLYKSLAACKRANEHLVALRVPSCQG